MTAEVPVRPMQAADLDGLSRVIEAAFTDLIRRRGGTRRLPPAAGSEDQARATARLRHLLATDPGGAWVAEEHGRVSGGALSLLREGLWGLSLLIVDPDHQGAGVGRRLLDAALAYGSEARGGAILSSSDPRAIRRYAQAGFAMHPCVLASGRVDREALPALPGVRDGAASDLELAAEVDRAVRGAAHGSDLAQLLQIGCRFFVVPGRGYAIFRSGGPKIVAATDEEAAQSLLWAVLADAGDAGVEIDGITARQGWALDVCLAAGLGASPEGAVFLRGDVGPFAPYLPSGAYL